MFKEKKSTTINLLKKKKFNYTVITTSIDLLTYFPRKTNHYCGTSFKLEVGRGLTLYMLLPYLSVLDLSYEKFYCRWTNSNRVTIQICTTYLNNNTMV